MSENVVINDTTYNGVDALALVRADGTVATFFPDAVRYKAQTLTEAQKAQARANIGAHEGQGFFYIEGTGDTEGTWLGSHPDIKEYTPGMTALYKVPVAGASTTTLNINNLGAVTVVRNATTSVSTNYPVNSIVMLTYTVDSGTAYFKQADYDANTKTSAGTGSKTGTKLYLAGATSQSSSGVTTYSNANCYIGTNNRLYSGGEVVPNTADINALIDAKLAAFPDASEVEY